MRRLTTRARFAGLAARIALLAAFAAAAPAAVPTPESHFGHKIGADRTVLDWDRVVSYFHALAASSDRILVKELGKSTEAVTQQYADEIGADGYGASAASAVPLARKVLTASA